MIFSSIKNWAIPEGKVVKVESDGVVIWKEPSSLKNWVKYSTESDGKTIYNDGLGYKVGYRIRSGGAESASTYGVCIGFIPLKVGDVLSIYPAFTGRNTENTINFYDSSFSNLGQVTDSGSYSGICNSSYKTSVVNGVSTLTLNSSHNSNIAYVRIGHYTSATSNGEDIIITVNQEIV